MMTKYYFIAIFGILAYGVKAQKFKKTPESKIMPSEVEKHIRFLASDELMGRKTGHAGNNTAARYIAEEFRSFGLEMVSSSSFYQAVSFMTTNQPTEGSISGGDVVLKINDDFLLMNGGGINIENVEKAHIGYAWASEDGTYNDYKDVDVRGKIVVAQIGTPDAKGFREMMAASERKMELAKKYGALALIEVFTIPAPWNALQKNFGNGTISIEKKGKTNFTRILINQTTAKIIGKEVVKRISLKVEELVNLSTPSNNVIGMIEGSDPNLKSEYVLLSAHFDHVGFHEEHEEGEDYIFNGARDNAIGVSALLSAAKALSTLPAKRSVLFIAYTGEEIGLKGSGYYAENPMLPLNKCIFNLNIDGAGYNDKTLVSGIGIKRTGAEVEITRAVEAVGLKLIDDPTPELGLFDRSDNVQMAAKGIPAPSFSPGFTSFDEEISKYYHKEADEADNLDFVYLAKFAKSYAFAARLISNMKTVPKWISGDKYEALGEALYKN
ncbi:MAG: hypothetical protein ACI9DJ_002931 [Algoriphagus sp.]|jgi:hypothetical protein